MFTLPPLPYAEDALEPHLSAKTFSFHYHKHHQAYVTNLNGLIEGTMMAGMTLENIILESARAAGQDPSMIGVFNNAAQVWNHTFYWNSMKPQGGGKPTGKILELIEKEFETYEKFRAAFKQAGATQFGSGWAWLVLVGDSVKIAKSANADLPLIHGQRALLTCDVWEHAYYIDYQNRRVDYLDVFLDHLVNWDFAAQNLEAA